MANLYAWLQVDGDKIEDHRLLKLTERPHTPAGSRSLAQGDVIWGQKSRPCGIWKYMYDVEMNKGAMLLEFSANDR